MGQVNRLSTKARRSAASRLGKAWVRNPSPSCLNLLLTVLRSRSRPFTPGFSLLKSIKRLSRRAIGLFITAPMELVIPSPTWSTSLIGWGRFSRWIFVKRPTAVRTQLELVSARCHGQNSHNRGAQNQTDSPSQKQHPIVVRTHAFSVGVRPPKESGDAIFPFWEYQTTTGTESAGELSLQSRLGNQSRLSPTQQLLRHRSRSWAERS